MPTENWPLFLELLRFKKPLHGFKRSQPLLVQEHQTVKSTGPTASETAELNGTLKTGFDSDFEIVCVKTQY